MRQYIVNLSGGKDSTALFLRCIEEGWPIHSAVFFDSGWEFPQMHNHIEKLRQRMPVPIVRVTPKHSFDKLLLKYRWPAMHRRWCTGLKVRAIDEYVKENNGISLIGFAFDEKHRTNKKKFSCGCMATDLGCTSSKQFLFPLIDWEMIEADALAYCLERGFDWGGLYEHFDRVSCFCCPLKGSPDAWRKIRKYYPGQWATMLKMDAAITNNRGFYGHKTVYNLDRRFSEEDRQYQLWPVQDHSGPDQSIQPTGKSESSE